MASPLSAALMDAELRALADWSVATQRKSRRRWSSALRQGSADDVLAISLELFERFNHRWDRV